MASSPRDQTRAAAIRALTGVLSDQRTLEDALAHASMGVGTGEGGTTELSGWLQDVTAGTLRWKGRLDLAIDSASLKKKPTGWLRKALLVGAYQLIAQERTVPGAAVSETVDAVRHREGEAPAKFANAILRKVAEHAAAWRELAEPTTASVGKSAVPGAADENSARASLPSWLWCMLEKDHGREWAWKYACASLERPSTWIRAHDASWRSKVEGVTEGPVPAAWKLPPGIGAIPALPGFAEGEFIVQDISSQQLIANVAAEARRTLGSGKLRVLDLCAAPGGKSVGLQWSGFEVTASDVSAPRLALLRDTLKRTRLTENLRVVPREEITALPQQDLVWVDAPCSGSGILRRHPEVRWVRQEKDLPSLTAVQAELLPEAWEKVRPGGMLAYSVCSVLKDEGPRQIEKLRKGPAASATLVGEWLLAPQNAPGGDGFWCGLLRKPE